MAALRRSFRWLSEKKKTLTIAVPKSPSGFGFTVAWTKPPVVEFVNEGSTAEKAGVLPGDKIIYIDKIPVSKKGKEEIENIVKNVKEIMELEVSRPEGELSTRKRQTSLRRKESFTRKGTKMVIQDSQIMSWRRERALLKLLLCEEDLLNEILAGKEHFIMPLRKRGNLITPIEMDFLFVNIEEVCSVHERHIQQLRQLTQGTEDNVGRLYQKQVDERFSVLRKYVSGLTLAKILYKYKTRNKPFREFIESSRLSKEQPDLLQLIEKPFKYISDLTTQLAALLSCTAVGHRDYVCLESVVSIFRTFEVEMKEMMNRLSNFEDLKNIESAFDEDEPYINLETLQEKTLFTRGPKHFSLIHEDRYWLFAGYLAKVEGKHYIQYWALLLSDCLILARRTEQGVLLVLDEPVMLRSIYQVTFDVMKCDTEFRILFAVPNLHKSTEKRNQWATWILRTPCPGVKLLWQAILTHQLSLYSTEALSQGKKTSFVHAKPSLVLRGVLPKRTSKLEESSFVIEGPRAKASYSKRPAFSDSVLTGESEPFIDESNFLLKADGSKCEKLASFKLENDDKEGSYFSLTEAKVGPLKPHKKGVVRSKSFGNDFADSIPFIDCTEESNSGTESNIIYIRQPKTKKSSGTEGMSPKKTTEKPEVSEQAIADVKPSVSDFESVSEPGTPKKTDKLVQTDDSADSPGTGSLGKRTPKKRFPRLGTFERIKLENRKSNSEDLQEIRMCKTRTGTSAKHRRQISSTVSKEKLLKSDSASPIQDSKEISSSKESSPSVRQKPRRYFGRFWKKSTNTSGGSDKAEEVNEVTAKDSEPVQKSENDNLPDGEQTSEQTSKQTPNSSPGVLTGETENNNAKWTLTAMEKYMRDQSEASVALGLVAQPPTTNATYNKRRPTPVHQNSQHTPTTNGDAHESAGEETSPSWASSSTGNTPSFGSSGVTFEFNEDNEKGTPIITTTTCTPNSTPENKGHRKSSAATVTLSSSTELLEALDSGLELSLSKPRKSRKDSDSSLKGSSKTTSGSHGGTPTKTSKLSKLLRRTHSAGCSKDVTSHSLFMKEKAPVTKTKSADSAPCSREDGDEKQKKNRKTLAQDMKMRLSFLRRRHTDSSLQPSSVRPSPEEAHKWAESFQELTNSKYGLSLFRAFLSREFSEENIEFWLACEDYKRTRANKLVAKARKLYDDFVAVQAPKEVNLDSSMRSAIYDHLQNPDRHSFDSAQRRIQGLMEQDAYVRFLQSDLYTDLIQGNSPNTSS